MQHSLFGTTQKERKKGNQFKENSPENETRSTFYWKIIQEKISLPVLKAGLNKRKIVCSGMQIISKLDKERHLA